jgi:hypothetical protein
MTDPEDLKEDPTDPAPEYSDNSPKPEDGDQTEISQDAEIDYSLDSL